MATVAGHDINYISLAGALGAHRRAGRAAAVRAEPPRRLRRRGDVAGLRRRLRPAGGPHLRPGPGGRRGDGRRGGAAHGTGPWPARRRIWDGEPGTNLLDSGAHFYEVYATADGGHIAVGALEPQFYARLLRVAGHPAGTCRSTSERAGRNSRSARGYLRRPHQPRSGCDLLSTRTPARPPCWGPFEAHRHPHMAARRTFIELDGVRQPLRATFQPYPGPGDAGRARLGWGAGALGASVLRSGSSSDGPSRPSASRAGASRASASRAGASRARGQPSAGSVNASSASSSVGVVRMRFSTPARRSAALAAEPGGITSVRSWPRIRRSSRSR